MTKEEKQDCLLAWSYLKKANYFHGKYREIQAKYPARESDISKERLAKLIALRNHASDKMVEYRDMAVRLARKW